MQIRVLTNRCLVVKGKVGIPTIVCIFKCACSIRLVNLPALSAYLPCWPACLVGLSALLPYLLCFVHSYSACSSKWILATLLTVKTRPNKIGSICH
jgi:hypothetical protein